MIGRSRQRARQVAFRRKKFGNIFEKKCCINHCMQWTSLKQERLLIQDGWSECESVDASGLRLLALGAGDAAALLVRPNRFNWRPQGRVVAPSVTAIRFKPS